MYVNFETDLFITVLSVVSVLFKLATLEIKDVFRLAIVATTEVIPELTAEKFAAINVWSWHAVVPSYTP